MSKSWRSMARAPKDAPIAAVLRPGSSNFKITGVRVIEVSWLADESCWWTSGCLRYDADEFIGWAPLPAETA